MHHLGPTSRNSDSVGQSKSKAYEILTNNPKWICCKGLSIAFWAVGYKTLKDNNCLLSFVLSMSPCSPLLLPPHSNIVTGKNIFLIYDWCFVYCRNKYIYINCIEPIRSNLVKYLVIFNLGCTSNSTGRSLKYYCWRQAPNQLTRISEGRPRTTVFLKSPLGDTEAQKTLRVT